MNLDDLGHPELQELVDRLAKRLIETLSRDRLTGLYNAEALKGLVPELARRAKQSDRDVATLFVEVDHFKTINSQFGMAGGDRALQEIGRSLQATAQRHPDLDAEAYRRSGDEFVVACRVPDRAKAERLAEEVRSGVEALELYLPVAEGEERCSLRVSVGWAFADPDSSDLLLQHAESAARLAKRDGGNVVREHEASEVAAGEVRSRGDCPACGAFVSVEAERTPRPDAECPVCAARVRWHG